jgi:hypothetical protein
MGKITYRGWQHSAADAPQPTGIIFQRSLRQRLSFGASDEEQAAFAEEHPGDLIITPVQPKKE